MMVTHGAAAAHRSHGASVVAHGAMDLWWLMEPRLRRIVDFCVNCVVVAGMGSWHERLQGRPGRAS